MILRSMTAAALVLLAGCATTPVPPGQASPVPADRLLGFQQAEPGDATLVVTRDKGFLGKACYYSFGINNEDAALFAESETATFHVEPGEVLLRSGRKNGGKLLCGMNQDEYTQREFNLDAGQTKYFRISISPDGDTDIERTR